MVRNKIVIITVVIVAVVLLVGLGKILFKPKPKYKAEIAVIIDDWGYNLRCVRLLKQIKTPFTASVLPNLNYSGELTEILKQQNKQIILHLPLQPESAGERSIGLEQGTINEQMTDQQILDQLKKDLSSVPYAQGVSNHMGSKATKNERIMSVIFRYLKKNKLFFVDNFVTDKSICKDLANKMLVKFVSRDVFLDNKNDYESIKGQFIQLKEFALSNKQAVGVGHARPLTLQVFKDMAPGFEQEGIRFTFVSEMVE